MTTWDVDEVTTRRRLDAHIAQLEYDIRRNDQRIAQLHESNERKLRELAEVTGRRAREPDEIRAVGEPEPDDKPRPRGPRDKLPDASLRDRIVRLRTFTAPELAAALEVKPGTVRSHPAFKAMLADGTLKEADKFRGQIVYEYVKPEEPGTAFEVQQTTPPPRPPPAAPVEGTGAGYLNSLDKQLRIVARQAMRDGWALQPSGSGHFELTRAGHRPVHIPGTPQNAAEEAKQLRRRLKFTQPRAQAAKRGTPVAYTGRTPGTSGKPGQDRKTMRRTGRKVKKKRET